MTVGEFASSLFEVKTNAHIAHLQSKSYAEHMALNTLYTDIEDILDSFVESYQGKYGIVKGYKSFTIEENLDPVPYLKGKVKEYEAYRETLKDGYLQQLCDDVMELMYSTIYKLRFLL